MRGTVRFADNVKVLLQDKPAAMLEVGSHKILSKVMKTLWEAGLAVDLKAFRSEKDGRKIPLPASASIPTTVGNKAMPIGVKKKLPREKSRISPKGATCRPGRGLFSCQSRSTGSVH
jgi:hypothetical protein